MVGNENVEPVLVTWISRVLGMQRKLTTTESFFMNSEAISPSPAPWSQSRTKSRLVRIWTARDHENKPSDVGRNNKRDTFILDGQANTCSNSVVTTKLVS